MCEKGVGPSSNAGRESPLRAGYTRHYTDDFSVSLDACCAEDRDKMGGSIAFT